MELRARAASRGRTARGLCSSASCSFIKLVCRGELKESTCNRKTTMGVWGQKQRNGTPQPSEETRSLQWKQPTGPQIQDSIRQPSLRRRPHPTANHTAAPQNPPNHKGLHKPHLALAKLQLPQAPQHQSTTETTSSAEFTSSAPRSARQTTSGSENISREPITKSKESTATRTEHKAETTTQNGLSTKWHQRETPNVNQSLHQNSWDQSGDFEEEVGGTNSSVLRRQFKEALNANSRRHPPGVCRFPCLNGGQCVNSESCDCSLYQATGHRCQTVPNQGFEREMTCRSWGQYNFETFDGLYFHFPGRCTYTLLRDCEESSGLTVQVHNDPDCGSSSYSCRRSVSLFMNWDGEIRLNAHNVTFKGQRLELPHHIHDLVLEQISDYVLATQHGFTLAWDGLRGSVYVKLSPDFVGRTCGLCGNFNADVQDDLRTSYGVFTEEIEMFGNSWQEAEPNENRCPIVSPGFTSPCSGVPDHVLQKVHDVCSLLLEPPFSSCHEFVSPLSYMASCSNDLCLSGPVDEMLCLVLSEYARACAHADHPLNQWRQAFPLCGNWRECISCCPQTCSQEKSCIDSRLACVDGCYCPEDLCFLSRFVLESGSCVLPSECPCEHHGLMYPSGQTLDDRCNTCTCVGGVWNCTDYTCPDVVEMQELSSMFVQVKTVFGLRLQYSWSESRLYLQLDQRWLQDTVGLCGTFNGNSQDDFLSPSGMIESTPQLFGNGWRVSSACAVSLSTPQIDPCDAHQQAVSYATEKCSVLTQDLFVPCHDHLSPGSFLLQCRSDACKCGAPCFCAALAHYARHCRQHGVFIDFRANIPECAVTCPYSMVYGPCVSSCLSLSFPPQRSRVVLDGLRSLRLVLSAALLCSVSASGCSDECEEGCVCPEGTFYNHRTRTCVQRSECPCSFLGADYEPGDVIMTSAGVQLCLDGKLVSQTPASDGLCPVGQLYLNCSDSGVTSQRGVACERTCESYLLNLTCSSHEPCVSGCVCPPGLLKHGDECFEPQACPCLWKGKEYFPGDRVSSACHHCVCQHGTFQCVFRPCASMCSAYGDRHYRTFDGLLFDFVGICRVHLLKSSVDTPVSVTAENVDCFDSGVICRKSLLLSVGQTFIAFDDDSGKPNPSSVIDRRQRVFMFSAGIFSVVNFYEEDLTVLWDRKTTVHIQAGPRWQGKLSGLCGNFDLKTVNEMRTPENIESPTPQEFGNSWTASECLNSPDVRPPCSVFPLREPFAKRQCSVLLSEVFQSCHPVVDVTWFYINCVSDTCSCSRGGDCECFCSSVAAYAQRCCLQGVSVDWRSPSLCPYDCEYYNKVLGKGPYRLIPFRDRTSVLASSLPPLSSGSAAAAAAGSSHGSSNPLGSVFLVRANSSDSLGYLSKFMMTPGLSRSRPHDTSRVSFEAADRPNYFLFASPSGEVRLSKWRDSGAFWDGATFILHRDTWIPGFVSLEAQSKPGFFLHVTRLIHLLKYRHTDSYRKATLFRLTGASPDASVSPQCQWRYDSCSVPCFKTCSDPRADACTSIPQVEACLPVCPSHLVLDEVTHRCVHLQDCINPPVGSEISAMTSSPASNTTTTAAAPPGVQQEEQTTSRVTESPLFTSRVTTSTPYAITALFFFTNVMSITESSQTTPTTTEKAEITTKTTTTPSEIVTEPAKITTATTEIPSRPLKVTETSEIASLTTPKPSQSTKSTSKPSKITSKPSKTSTKPSVVSTKPTKSTTKPSKPSTKPTKSTTTTTLADAEALRTSKSVIKTTVESAEVTTKAVETSMQPSATTKDASGISTKLVEQTSKATQITTKQIAPEAIELASTVTTATQVSDIISTKPAKITTTEASDVSVKPSTAKSTASATLAGPIATKTASTTTVTTSGVEKETVTAKVTTKELETVKISTKPIAEALQTTATPLLIRTTTQSTTQAITPSPLVSEKSTSTTSVPTKTTNISTVKTTSSMTTPSKAAQIVTTTTKTPVETEELTTTSKTTKLPLISEVATTQSSTSASSASPFEAVTTKQTIPEPILDWKTTVKVPKPEEVSTNSPEITTEIKRTTRVLATSTTPKTSRSTTAPKTYKVTTRTESEEAKTTRVQVPVQTLKPEILTTEGVKTTSKMSTLAATTTAKTTVAARTSDAWHFPHVTTAVQGFPSTKSVTTSSVTSIKPPITTTVKVPTRPVASQTESTIKTTEVLKEQATVKTTVKPAFERTETVLVTTAERAPLDGGTSTVRPPETQRPTTKTTEAAGPVTERAEVLQTTIPTTITTTTTTTTASAIFSSSSTTTSTLAPPRLHPSSTASLTSSTTVSKISTAPERVTTRLVPTVKPTTAPIAKLTSTTASTTKLSSTTASTTKLPSTSASTTKLPSTTASTTKLRTTTASTAKLPSTTASTIKLPSTTTLTTKLRTTTASTTKLPSTITSTTKHRTTTASIAKLRSTTARAPVTARVTATDTVTTRTTLMTKPTTTLFTTSASIPSIKEDLTSETRSTSQPKVTQFEQIVETTSSASTTSTKATSDEKTTTEKAEIVASTIASKSTEKWSAIEAMTPVLLTTVSSKVTTKKAEEDGDEVKGVTEVSTIKPTPSTVLDTTKSTETTATVSLQTARYCTPPYTEIVDECSKLICLNHQLVLYNKSLSCPFTSEPPNCGLLGFAVLVNGDKCCPQSLLVVPDLSVITFDGNSVAVFKAASYVITELQNETLSVSVQECGADSSSPLLWNFTHLCLVALNITHKSNHVIVNRLQRRLYVNSRYARPRFKKFGFEIYDTGNMYLIRTPAGLRLQWFHSTGLMVVDTEAHYNRLTTKGLCGDGSFVSDAELFIESWTVFNTSSSFSFSQRRRDKNCSTSDCSECLRMLQGPDFSSCHQYVPPSTFCELWVRDTEYVNNHCVALSAYVASCHSSTSASSGENQTTAVTFVCPDGLQYQSCFTRLLRLVLPKPGLRLRPGQCSGLTEGCVVRRERFCTGLTLPLHTTRQVRLHGQLGLPRSHGEVWKVSHDACCMYRCENDTIVPVEFNCSGADPQCSRQGEVVISLAHENSCCPVKLCVCNQSLCELPPPLCNYGEKLVSYYRQDSCCPQYSCECDPELCESVVPSCRDDQTLISTKADQSCCLAHICMCLSCSEAPPVCQEGEVLAVDFNTTDRCCPLYQCVCEPQRCPQISCSLGESPVSSSVPGRCCPQQTCECACDRIASPKCGLNQIYVPPKDQSTCCGSCKNISCSYEHENGTTALYKPGRSWISNCVKYDCADTESGSTLISLPISCPPFNGIECLQVNVVSCDGKCPSASIYNYNINTYARFCKCCRETGLQKRTVQLYCSNNSTWVNYDIQEPTDCSCLWS
ncbi:hypothetical protein WMY93_006221 [Mugilogobius chulae]|uniref:Otogelin n=1 Tax=Mugilogobius chulae TaxID=88201 RepID=A0AAW0PLV2_9GOBI